MSAQGPDRVESFAPIAAPDAKLLLLGSSPSVRSLAAGQYYGHPQNLFWVIMGELVGAGLDREYADRAAILQSHGIALWDVARLCRREGSADATMTDVEANDIGGLLRRCPGIRAIFCNGRKAEQMFRRLVVPRASEALEGRHTGYLPSTSPAHASVPRREKIEIWRNALNPWLR